jgi:hypothetical protein
MHTHLCKGEKHSTIDKRGQNRNKKGILPAYLSLHTLPFECCQA